MEKINKNEKSVSIRKALVYICGFTVIVSVLLLIATGSVSTVNSDLNKNIASYTQWQKDANNLQIGSDYLTEQVRSFVVTGDRTYLDNYFEEANVTRRRDHAVEGVRRLMGETEAYKSLTSAMDESLDLMNREYYAMRLAAAGFGLDTAAYPREVRDVELSAADLAASPEKQRETARSMVFDEIYHGKKQAITGNIQECLASMDAELEASQEAAQNKMRGTILQQRIMIGVVIAAMFASILMFMRMVVWPLLNAVTFIQKDQPIPVEGAEEFRFLAREYNAAYQTNIEQKQELAYEATHDVLTGVYNRNGYNSILKNVDWNHCALVLFDLDSFKGVNDQYGHHVGDWVLKRTAKAIQNTFRAQDHVCRIGGDEFAVIMDSVTIDSGDLICEKIRHINEELLSPKDSVPAIHISAGAAFGALIPDYDELFRKADAAVYHVKNNGGGGCEVVQ